MPLQFVNLCKSCALRQDNIQSDTGSICLISKLQVDPVKDYCSQHRFNIPQCDICGQATIEKLQVYKLDDGSFISMCGECAKQLGQCRTCTHGTECTFETSSSSAPKTIQKQIQQGNSIFVGQVKNPERVRQTCQNGCPCFSSNNLCLKQTPEQTCQQYLLLRQA